MSNYRMTPEGNYYFLPEPEWSEPVSTHPLHLTRRYNETEPPLYLIDPEAEGPERRVQQPILENFKSTIPLGSEAEGVTPDAAQPAKSPVDIERAMQLLQKLAKSGKQQGIHFVIPPPDRTGEEE